MDLRNLSQTQLDALIAKAQARRDSLERGQLDALRKKVKALIADSGYTMADVLGNGAGAATRGRRGRPKKAVDGAVPGKRRGRKAAAKTAVKAKTNAKTKAKAGKVRKGYKVKPKYRNPADPKMTWAGRGMQPRWFREALAAGKKEKDLLI